MKVDNFDLRQYLTENKMTENSRGDVRIHLGKTVLDTRILSEMRIPVDPDQEDSTVFNGEHIEECGDLDMNMPVNEAGYTDDEDDFYGGDDLDLDDRGGASLLDLIGNDRGAAKARKAAAKDTAEDPAMDDDPVDPELDGDGVPDDEEDPEAAAAGTSDPNAEVQPGLSAEIKYNPNTVEMMMSNEELDQYLSGFRRPQVAVNVLNRAIRTAQNEVNESIGLKHLYIILENGFYVTSRSQRGQVIAKVSADEAWRQRNFG